MYKIRKYLELIILRPTATLSNDLTEHGIIIKARTKSPKFMFRDIEMPAESWKGSLNKNSPFLLGGKFFEGCQNELLRKAYRISLFRIYNYYWFGKTSGRTTETWIDGKQYISMNTLKRGQYFIFAAVGCGIIIIIQANKTRFSLASRKYYKETTSLEERTKIDYIP